MKYLLPYYGDVDIDVRVKDDSLMRFWAPKMITTFRGVVYIPRSWGTPEISDLAHEYTHVLQQKKWGLLFYVLYLFGPFPIFFSLFRAKVEAAAYAFDVEYGVIEIADVADELFSASYWWAAPKSLVRKWVRAAMRKFDVEGN